MARLGDKPENLRSMIVLSIPDVTAEISEENEASSARFVASRARNKSVSRSAKNLVLVSVFLFYAFTGMLAVKAVVWIYGGTGSVVNEMAMETERPDPITAQDEKQATWAKSTPLPSPNRSHDPAISEQLRGLLTRGSVVDQRLTVQTPVSGEMFEPRWIKRAGSVEQDGKRISQPGYLK